MSYTNKRKRKCPDDSQAGTSSRSSRHTSRSRSSTSRSFQTIDPVETVSASSSTPPSGFVHDSAPSTSIHRVSVDTDVSLASSSTKVTTPPRANPHVPYFKTPIDRLSKIVADTPAKSRTSESSEYRSKYVDRQRRAIFEEMGKSIPRGSLDYFFSIMPPLPPAFDLEKITDYLVESGDLVQWDGSYVWKEFKEIPKAKESMIYNQPLVNIFKAITRAAEKTALIEPTPTPTLDLITDGRGVPWSARGSKLRPDGYFVLRETRETRPEKVLWYNIAACLEFKKETGAVKEFENIQQTIHNMQHVLAIDPTRRFTYGISIERTNLKLWLATRAMLISCDSFDFRTKYKELIRILLSLSFANRESLGWDMTMDSELGRDDNRKYNLEVSGEHYHTNEKCLISGDKANGLVSSGTRIWHATKFTEGSKEDVIIKDYWPSEDRETEDDIHQMIVEDISDPEKKEYFKEHTLSVLASERVKACDTEDNTRDTILSGRSPDMSTLYEFSIPGVESSQNGTCAGATGISYTLGIEFRELVEILKRNQRTNYYHRRHHRIVYKEVAIPYDKLTNTKDMYIVLVDVLKTLLIMHEAGWVHRDISVGNLYLYVDPKNKLKRGLIGDFEYAKRVGKDGKHDIRTGTPNFMAIEIASHIHHFLSTKHTTASLREQILSGLTPEQIKGRTNHIKHGIFHNYLHDLESLWWVLVWTAFRYEKAPTMNDEDSVRSALTQKEHYLSLFPGHKRQAFLVENDAFEEIVSQLPPFFSKQQEAIDLFRLLLVTEYYKEETDVSRPVFLSDPFPVHESILQVFLKREFDEFEVVSVFDRNIEKNGNVTEGPSPMDVLPPAPKRSRTT